MITPNTTPDDAQAGAPAAIGIPRAVATVFLPFAGGYYLSYLYRSVNAIIAEPLVRDIGLGAADLGLLTAAYLLAFALFQVPLGVLLDRFGPRRVQSCLLLSAALGAFVFSRGETREVLLLGRALIGLGVAGGLMASFKAITLWFPRERWPLVNGCFLSMGGLGVISATVPVEMLLHVTDWRGIFVGLSLATVCASLVIYLIVPEKPATARPPALAEQVESLRRIYRDRLFWRLAPMAMACMAASMAIQGLWIGPWLRDVAGLDRAGVAEYLLANAASMTVGFIAGGLVADLLGRIGIGLVKVMGGGVLLFMAAQAAIISEVDPTGVWPWVLFGLTGNLTVLAYPQLSRHFPVEYAARANTGLNVLVFGGAFFAQYAMGAIIDLFPAAPGGGYADAAYRTAFGSFLALQAAAFLWFIAAGRRGA